MQRHQQLCVLLKRIRVTPLLHAQFASKSRCWFWPGMGPSEECLSPIICTHPKGAIRRWHAADPVCKRIPSRRGTFFFCPPTLCNTVSLEVSLMAFCKGLKTAVLNLWGLVAQLGWGGAERGELGRMSGRPTRTAPLTQAAGRCTCTHSSTAEWSCVHGHASLMFVLPGSKYAMAL